MSKDTLGSTFEDNLFDDSAFESSFENFEDEAGEKEEPVKEEAAEKQEEANIEEPDFDEDNEKIIIEETPGKLAEAENNAIGLSMDAPTSEENVSFTDNWEEDPDFDSDMQENNGNDNKSEDAPVAEKKDKKSNKKGKKKSKKQSSNNTDDEDEEEYIPKNADDVILLVVTDENKPQLLSYFRENRLKVSKLFDNIKDIRDEMLMQTELHRVVVIDTGKGRFTSPSARQEVLDMLGMRDEETRISIFYTDTALRSEAQRGGVGKSSAIEWNKYYSTVDVTAKLLGKYKKEHYVYDMKQDDPDLPSKEKVLATTGISMKLQKGLEQPQLKPMVELSVLKIDLDSSGESIEDYMKKRAP
jgi:hypothetical protein